MTHAHITNPYNGWASTPGICDSIRSWAVQLPPVRHPRVSPEPVEPTTKRHSCSLRIFQHMAPTGMAKKMARSTFICVQPALKNSKKIIPNCDSRACAYVRVSMCILNVCACVKLCVLCICRIPTCVQAMGIIQNNINARNQPNTSAAVRLLTTTITCATLALASCSAIQLLKHNGDSIYETAWWNDIPSIMPRWDATRRGFVTRYIVRVHPRPRLVWWWINLRILIPSTHQIQPHVSTRHKLPKVVRVLLAGMRILATLEVLICIWIRKMSQRMAVAVSPSGSLSASALLCVLCYRAAWGEYNTPIAVSIGVWMISGILKVSISWSDLEVVTGREE